MNYLRRMSMDLRLRSHSSPTADPAVHRCSCTLSDADWILDEKPEHFRRRLYSSPATDMVCRRGAFSRKNYGSVETIPQDDWDDYINTAGRFRAENGHPESLDSPGAEEMDVPIHLENPESQTRWYFKYFLGKVHQVYGGVDADHEPFVLAVVLSEAENPTVPQYRAVLWKRNGSQKICIPHNSASPLSAKKILSYFDMQRFEKAPKEIFNPQVQKDVLTLEEQEGSVNFKFGILYFKDGQLSDEDMYNNQYASGDFYRFVALLGDPMLLENWNKFKGGLDTKSNTTGRYSYYTVYEGHEIMFHVSTLLPYTKDNRQQVERKRHIGNDIVNIIFVEGSPNAILSWKPSMMKTHFTHIFAVVWYNRDADLYRLHVFSEESVPLFGPPLPSVPDFKDHAKFREFLLVKLINGEKAAFHSPVFAQKRQRTYEMLLQNVLETFILENTKTILLTRKAFSDIVADQQMGISTRKEVSRSLDFMRIGQSLKVETIVNGEAPTSLVTTGTHKRPPWQPHMFLPNFSHQIICGDTCGENLIVGTEHGTFMLYEDGTHRQLLDSSVVFKQIEVLDDLGILVGRIDKNKDSRLVVMQLVDLDDAMSSCKSKNILRDFRIEKTKGCHVFAVSKSPSPQHRLVVAVGRRLLLFVWRCSTKWSSLSSWNQMQESEIVAGFVFLRELQTFEPVQLVTLTENGWCGGCGICVAYRGHFDLLDEMTGDTVHLYRTESDKVIPTAALDICADDQPELLLAYNRTCHFQKLNFNFCPPKPSTNIDANFNWSIEPKSIAMYHPYIIAFSNYAIEIRLLVNGSLVHTLDVYNCTFLTSKTDIYFVSTDQNLDQEKELSSPRVEKGISSRESQQKNGQHTDFHVYRIPQISLIGGVKEEMATKAAPGKTRPSNLEGLDMCNKMPKALAVSRMADLKQRHSSSGNEDSGINMRTGDSPVLSPEATLGAFSSFDADDVLETDII